MDLNTLGNMVPDYCRLTSVCFAIFYCAERLNSEDRPGSVLIVTNYHYSYHSCRNRHCLRCENDKTTDWLDAQKNLLLSVQYFMSTVTVPEALRPVIRKNQKALYSLLFQSSAEGIQDLALDKRFIGGKIGLVGVLQTWTQHLGYHPHIHFIIPGCALLPRGFVKVRYYGFLPSKNRAVLDVVKKQLGVLLTPVKRTIKKGLNPFKCPKCGRPMRLIGELPRKRGPPVLLFLNMPAFSKSI